LKPANRRSSSSKSVMKEPRNFQPPPPTHTFWPTMVGKGLCDVHAVPVPCDVGSPTMGAMLYSLASPWGLWVGHPVPQSSSVWNRSHPCARPG
jgi:hypothetical protein